MFKKDRYSILIFAVMIILLNPSRPLFEMDQDILFGIFFVTQFIVMIVLLYLNNKLKENKFFSILLKSLKISVLAWLLFVIVDIMRDATVAEGVQSIFNSIFRKLPKMLVHILLLFLPVLGSVLVASAVAYFLRIKFKFLRLSDQHQTNN